MQQKIEGLILKKSNYGERHIISDLLLRSGKKVTVTFYGGRGGGKKNKPSTLDLGNLVAVELTQKNRTGDVYAAKEWLPKWRYEKIRANYKAFYLACTFLEIISKVSDFIDLKEKVQVEDNTDEGFFRILGNGIYFIEKDLEQNPDSFNFRTHFFVFIAKMLFEMGIYPMREECILTGEKILENQPVGLLPDQGGFARLDLVGQEVSPKSAAMIWKLLGVAWDTPYKNLNFNFEVSEDNALTIFEYFCYQLSLKKSDFRSLRLLL